MSKKYYHTKESVDEYIELAKDVSGIELIKKLKLVLPENSSVLELGSGPGTDWQILNQSYQVTGSDYSLEFLDHLNTQYPGGVFLQLDASTIEFDQKFDAIYSNKVFQHLTNEELESSIKRQHAILNPQGIICHSFWKGEGEEVFKGTLVNYQTENSLRNFFGSYFEIVTLTDYAEFEEGDSLLLIGRKKDSKYIK